MGGFSNGKEPPGVPVPSLWLNTVTKMQYRGVVVKSSCSGLLSSPFARLSLSVLPYKWWSRWLSGLRTLLPMQETRVRSLGQEEPLEKEMATHSSILAWEIHGWRSLAGNSP